mgnify:CR=1 FL=1
MVGIGMPQLSHRRDRDKTIMIESEDFANNSIRTREQLATVTDDVAKPVNL